jgi:ribonuclease D
MMIAQSNDSKDAEAIVADDAGRSISKDELNKLPIKAYSGPIHVIHDAEQIKHALPLLEAEDVLGFDTETRPSFERGVSYPPALLQLATRSDVFIFQLQALGGLGPLRAILESRSITKAGAAISDDIKQLNDCWAFKPHRFIEIGHLAKELGYKQTGLRTLAGLTLGFRISKKEQRSNWAKPRLTQSQIVYAATDAWVSRELYLHLMAAWGDRTPPAEVDPLTPDPTLVRKRSDNRSSEHRPARKRGRNETAAAHTPELPGLGLSDPASP